MSRLSSAWFAGQRWFAAKDTAEEPAEGVRTAIDDELSIEIVTVGEHSYQLVSTTEEPDSLGDPDTGRALARAFADESSAEGPAGSVSFYQTERTEISRGSVRTLDAEQSNTSLVIDELLILKVIRRLQPGPHPEVEMLAKLAGAGCREVPRLAGWYETAGGPVEATLGVLQEFVADAVDGWRLILDGLAIDARATIPLLHGLGSTLCSIHRVLGAPTSDPDFSVVEGGKSLSAGIGELIVADAERLATRLADQSELHDLGDSLREAAHLAPRLADCLDAGPTLRHHGDLHLGQTLHGPHGWLIIDWEGEPARTLAQRRSKQSPLRDVAGMLRSFEYAAATHARARGTATPIGWLTAARAAFLDGYLADADPRLLPPSAGSTVRMLALLELEKVVYEVGYEVANRPDWLAIPVSGLKSLLEANRT